MRCFVIILGRVTDAKYRRILGSSFQERMARCSKDDIDRFRLLIEMMMIMREIMLMNIIDDRQHLPGGKLCVGQTTS